MDDVSVLLVDDEAEYLETLAKRLRRRGLRIETVGSGEEALGFLAESAVDVVVLDVKMPGMDGIAALREIKGRHPLIEVIMLTGHASLEAAIEGMEVGAFDYLMKPANLEELLYKVEDAHKKKTLQEQKIRRAREMGPAASAVPGGAVSGERH